MDDGIADTFVPRTAGQYQSTIDALPWSDAWSLMKCHQAEIAVENEASFIDGIEPFASCAQVHSIGTQRTGPITKSVRIGITRDVDWLLRFYDQGNAQVSGPKKLSPIAMKGTD